MILILGIVELEEVRYVSQKPKISYHKLGRGLFLKGTIQFVSLDAVHTSNFHLSMIKV